MAKYSHAYGGVGAPVGLTVFKTAGGSLSAVPGGFDSHTPLPATPIVVVILPRICGRVKASDILFQKEDKGHAKSTKDLYRRV